MASAIPVPELADEAAACAERLQAADSVLVASHIDADGLTSAAIAATALERAEIPFETVFAKQLDEKEIVEIAATNNETVLFTDFGSRQLDIIAEHEAADKFTPVIADHHRPADATTEYHLNPFLVGLDGTSELSGAGTSYVLARALADITTSTTINGTAVTESGVKNRDLAALAVVGAVGDMQAGVDGLTGANEAIVSEGVDAGVVESETDITLYGKQTRPLPKLLEYASEARIPGISNDTAGAIEFLSDLDIDLETDDGWRCWVDLSDSERQTLLSALIQRAVESGVPADRIDDLLGTTYQLPREEPGTVLRDVNEFSTLLNATARYERADVGLAVCLGDRDEAFDRARMLMRDHHENLSEVVDWVASEGVTEEDNIQWFDTGSEIPETTVGMIANRAVGEPELRHDQPIIGFAEKNSEEIKVSARGSHQLTSEGLDLSVVVREASRAVDGEGSGHDAAADGIIPTGKQKAFVEAADRLIANQLTQIHGSNTVPDTIPQPPNVSVNYTELTETEPIGGGGNADVKKAILPDKDVTLAIKVPRMTGTLLTDTIESMLEEAETWDKLDDNDHIVSVLDYGATPKPWIAMEYMDGGHLGDRSGEMTLPQALWTATAVTKGVRHAHGRGFAHLDLKPANILFRSIDDGWDVPKVADWGLSKHLLDHSNSVEGLSPQYAAPEQFDDEYGATDDITDIYQLGAVFYELFTGEPPFDGKPFKVIRKIQDESPTPPSEIVNVPDELDDTLLTALAKQKDDRYEDILYFRDDIQELFDSVMTEAE